MPSTALQSLIVDEGVGTMLGMAIGDVAAHRDSYSSRTQIGTIIAYHLLESGDIDRSALVEAIVELGRPEDSVLTDPSPELSAWIRSAVDGLALATAIPSSEVATRAVPIGVWFRDDVDRLVSAVIESVLIENLDAVSVVTAVAVGGAVAGSTLAMSGWDLVLAAAETVDRGLGAMSDRTVSNFDRAAGVSRGLRGVRSMIDQPIEEIVHALGDLPDAIRPPLAAIVASADPAGTPPLIIEAAAKIGVDAAVVSGSILGARLGLRRWPWRVPNETWFAEIGRRLVRHEREVRDLPIPRSVEARMQRDAPVDPVGEIT